jgi:hypothetical protein
MSRYICFTNLKHLIFWNGGSNFYDASASLSRGGSGRNRSSRPQRFLVRLPLPPPEDAAGQIPARSTAAAGLSWRVLPRVDPFSRSGEARWRQRRLGAGAAAPGDGGGPPMTDCGVGRVRRRGHDARRGAHAAVWSCGGDANVRPCINGVVVASPRHAQSRDDHLVQALGDASRLVSFLLNLGATGGRDCGGSSWREPDGSV